MQMRSRDVAGGADAGNLLACMDGRTGGHEDFRSVCVVVLRAIGLDDHQVAVAAAPAGERDHSSRGGEDRITGVAVEIESVMHVRAADAQLPVAERGSNESARWPD